MRRFIIGSLEKRMGMEHLSDNFCRSFKDEEEEEIVLYLLGTCSALCLRRKAYLCSYFFDNLHELSGMSCGIIMGLTGPKCVYYGVDGYFYLPSY